ncbi:putative UDP-Gal or UDP-GlcNAc-dependent glycosyltransferase [Trypanosoma cruzi]|uniref:Putative UDP-Gal or UDP-GlcNAc-dependent glycosyltransferase n=1 Tax=Trypanosoma cruzi TaxID=5693 RepID=A0A2V2V135_TRYCR|nr:putative UDP-Gal or UDP-GlcNAc-dependent glycosyltransferase [Trypanosoma cruzi]
MLVLYVLGRHPSHGYDYSAALLEEVAQWHDVVALPMNEGRLTTNKTIGSYGSWGAEADVGMTRKTYMWFDLAVRLFPSARYITKGDDDIFSVCRYSLVTCAFCRAEGSTWGPHWYLQFLEHGLARLHVYVWLVLHLVEGCCGGVGVVQAVAAPGVPAVQQGT